MVLSKTLTNKAGGIFISKGTILNNELISRIKKLPFKEVEVYKSEKEQKKENNTSIEKRIKTAEKIFSHYDRKNTLPANMYNKIYNDILDLKEITNLKAIKLIHILNKQNDNTLITHSISVGILTQLFADKLDIKPSIKKELGIAGFLHDIGQINIFQDYTFFPTLSSL